MTSSSPSEQTRLAAIDLGSNGARIQIGSIQPSGQLKVIMSHRVGLRLGADAFALGHLRDETIEAAVDTFKMFRRRLNNHKVDHVRAVATSAARNSSNGHELVDRVADTSGIRLEIISGLEEAHLVFSAVKAEVDLRDKTALLVDMGGGSIEITIVQDGHTRASETLPLGPLRLKQELAAASLHERDIPMILARAGNSVGDLIESTLAGAPPDICVGTGGNIECMARLRHRLLGKSRKRRVSAGDLELLVPALLNMTIEERMSTLELRSDRADVIGIAAQIMHSIVDEARVDRVLVPRVGVKDGLFHQLLRQIADTCQR